MHRTYILYVRDTRGKTKSRSHDFDYFLMFDDDEMKWWNVTLESTLVATLNTNGKRVNKINNNIKSKYRWLRKTKGMEPVLWWTDDIFFQSSLFKVFQCSFNHCYTKRHNTHTRIGSAFIQQQQKCSSSKWTYGRMFITRHALFGQVCHNNYV